MQAELLTRPSQRDFEQLVNTVDSIVWEADAKTFAFSFVSQQAERLLGYPASRWVEEPNFWVEHIHPDDREWAVSFCGRATAEMRAHEFEYRMIASDGRVVWLRDIVTVVAQANRPKLLRGVMTDITERKLAEARQRETENQYRLIFESTTEGLFINELTEGRLVEFNPAAARMHGYTVEEFRKLHVADFIHPESHHLFRHYIESVRAGRQFRARATDIRKDGTRIEVEVFGTPFAYQGSPHALAVVRDVTEEVAAYRLLEDRVGERTRELSTLLEISREIASTVDIDRLLGVIIEELRKVVDYTGAALITFEGEQTSMRAYRGPIPDQQIRQLQLPPGGFAFQQEVVRRREAVIMPDVQADDPLARAFQATLGQSLEGAFRYIRSWLGVPLISKDRVLGILAISHSEPNFYEDRDADLALAFANQAAVAIESARLFEESRILAVVEERHRLARDLHDSVTQLMYSTTLFAEAARRAAKAQDHSLIEGYLSRLQDSARQALKELRLLVFQLRDFTPEANDLAASLEARLDAVERRSGVKALLSIEGERRLKPNARAELFWIAREALNNALKHAEANEVEVSLTRSGSGAEFAVADKGKGFDPATVPEGGLGMASIRERAERLGGALEIDSAPGRGTRLVVRFPPEAVATSLDEDHAVG